MSSNFEFRYIALTPEHTTTTGARSYGTASAGATAKVYGEVDDESFAHMFDLLTRSDMSRYGAAKSVNGKEYSEGGLNLVAQADDFLGMILYGAYGDDSGASSSAYTVVGNKHTWNEKTTLILPSFTIEVGREDKEHTYTGMCLSRLSISGTVGEYAMISADFNGKAESATSALATPTFVGASSDGFHFADGEILFSLDGAATNTASAVIKSISFELNTNLNTDDACSIGSQTYSRQPEPQMREITGSVEFSRPVITADTATDNPSYNQLIASDGLLYDGDAAQPAIQLKFTNAAAGELIFNIHKCRWEAPSMNVSGRDSSTMTVNFVALVDTASNIMSTASISTDASTVGRYSTL